jgi:hypothetical protein
MPDSQALPLQLTLPQIESGLRVVADSLLLQVPPSQISPPELLHLTPQQWESLLAAHLHLTQQRLHSPLH